MSFSENLKQIRREHHLSQEELAELLDVSRQAVSKWEQGQGYPEVETLLRLSRKLNLSLDALMSTGMDPEPGTKNLRGSGSIAITSPYENVMRPVTKWLRPGKCGVENHPLNMHCLVLTEAVQISGGNRLHFWRGMLIWNRFRRKFRKFIMRFPRELRPIR